MVGGHPRTRLQHHGYFGEQVVKGQIDCGCAATHALPDGIEQVGRYITARLVCCHAVFNAHRGEILLQRSVGVEGVDVHLIAAGREIHGCAARKAAVAVSSQYIIAIKLRGRACRLVHIDRHLFAIGYLRVGGRTGTALHLHAAGEADFAAGVVVGHVTLFTATAQGEAGNEAYSRYEARRTLFDLLFHIVICFFIFPANFLFVCHRSLRKEPLHLFIRVSPDFTLPSGMAFVILPFRRHL